MGEIFDVILAKADLSKAVTNYEKQPSHNQLMIDLQAELNNSNSLSQEEKDFANEQLTRFEQDAQNSRQLTEFDNNIISLIKQNNIG